MHQIVEYMLGIGLIAQGLQVNGGQAAVVAGSGLLVLVNASIVRGGALSAFRVVSRATHRVLDLVVIGTIVVLSLQPWLPMDGGARVIMLGIAAVLAFVWWQSSFAEPAARSTRSAASAASRRRSGTTSSEPAEPAEPAEVVDRSTQIGRTAGRLVGDGIKAGKRVAAKRRQTD